MAITSPFNVLETPDDIYRRMVEDLPEPTAGGEWNTRAGSIIHAILMPAALEISRLITSSHDVLSNGFLRYASGTALDDKVLEYGLTRRAALPASVTLLISGDEGTIINPGDSFSTEGNTALDGVGVEFLVLGGPYIIGPEEEIEVPAYSSDVGNFTNVDANTVVLITDAAVGVTAATNPEPAEGGRDTEDDETLRSRAILRASMLPASGNKATYMTLAGENVSVDAVGVEDLWRGAGTGKVILSRNTPVNTPPSTVDQIQTQFDPSVRTLAHCELPEQWRGDADLETSQALEGGASLVVATANASEVAEAYLEKVLDLSFWDASTDYIEFLVRRESASDTLEEVRLRLTDADGDYVEEIISGATVNALGSSSGKGTLSVEWGDFTESGTFNKAAVTKISFFVESTSLGAASVSFDGLRIYSVAGGHGDGEAPLGVQITVVSAAASYVDVEATVWTVPGVLLADIEETLKQDIENAIKLIPSSENVVRLARIANAIHDHEGVLDYSDVKVARAGVSPAASNLVLNQGERPRVDTITLTPGS